MAGDVCVRAVAILTQNILTQRVRYSVVTGKAAGRSTMPGRHGCKECCKGCQLRRCCRHCGPHNPMSDLYPHRCEHCHTLFHDGKMTLQDVEFAVFRSYTCMPRSCNEPPMPVAVSALWSRSAGNEPWTVAGEMAIGGGGFTIRQMTRMLTKKRGRPSEAAPPNKTRASHFPWRRA